MTLDEKALRKPEFTEGPRLVLGDGQEWAFPKPHMRLYPQRDDEGKVYMAGSWTFGIDHDDRLDRYNDNDQGEVIDKLEAQLQMAAELLTRNYSLDNKALRRILPVSLQGEENLEMWRSILDVMTGTVGPTPSPDDPDSTSSPTSQPEPLEPVATA